MYLLLGKVKWIIPCPRYFYSTADQLTCTHSTLQANDPSTVAEWTEMTGPACGTAAIKHKVEVSDFPWFLCGSCRPSNRFHSGSLRLKKVKRGEVYCAGSSLSVRVHCSSILQTFTLESVGIMFLIFLHCFVAAPSPAQDFTVAALAHKGLKEEKHLIRLVSQQRFTVVQLWRGIS